MEMVYTCRFSLFSSLAAGLIDWFAIGFKTLRSRCT